MNVKLLCYKKIKQQQQKIVTSVSRKWSLFWGAVCLYFYPCLLPTILYLHPNPSLGCHPFPLFHLCIVSLVVRTRTGPQGGMSSSLWSWVPLKKRPNTAWVTEPACLADIKLTVCPIPTVMFPAPSSRLSFWTPQSTHPTQTWTFLLWACNQNQGACNRGELFGLQTCCLGRRPCRVWIPFCGKRLAPWRRIQTQFWVKRW